MADQEGPVEQEADVDINAAVGEGTMCRSWTCLKRLQHWSAASDAADAYLLCRGGL